MDQKSRIRWIATYFVSGALLLIGLPETARWLNGGAFAQASPLVSPSSPAPAINQGPGSAYSFGQQGGITAGTLNIAPSRLQFNARLGNELLATMPSKNKPVKMTTIGLSNADQIVGRDIEKFLDDNGYSVNNTTIGMILPSPDRPISFMDLPDAYYLTVSPSAH